MPPAAVYYALRERQLAYQCKMVAAQGAAAWRQASVAGARPNELLAQRGRPPLHVQLPTTAGGVNPAENAVYLRRVRLCAPCSRPAAPCRAGGAAPAAPPAAAAASQGVATPPQQLEQPAKRSRLAHMSCPGSVMRAEAAPLGHLIARSSASLSGSPVVIAMPPLAACSCRPHASPSGSSFGSSPMGWLQRLSAGMSRLMTPSPTVSAT